MNFSKIMFAILACSLPLAASAHVDHHDGMSAISIAIHHAPGLIIVAFFIALCAIVARVFRNRGSRA
jgi:hypothetical protein